MLFDKISAGNYVAITDDGSTHLHTIEQKGKRWLISGYTGTFPTLAACKSYLIRDFIVPSKVRGLPNYPSNVRTAQTRRDMYASKGNSYMAKIYANKVDKLLGQA